MPGGADDAGIVDMIARSCSRRRWNRDIVIRGEVSVRGLLTYALEDSADDCAALVLGRRHWCGFQIDKNASKTLQLALRL